MGVTAGIFLASILLKRDALSSVYKISMGVTSRVAIFLLSEHHYVSGQTRKEALGTRLTNHYNLTSAHDARGLPEKHVANGNFSLFPPASRLKLLYDNKLREWSLFIGGGGGC